MPFLKRCLLAFGAMALAIGGASSSAQDVLQKPINVDVNVVRKLIQVSVTDRKGNPVMDLASADFEVTDNGRIVKIDFLEKHIYGSPAEMPVAAKVKVSPQLPRKFFFIFDLSFMNPNSFNKAKETALNFIDTVLQPGDEIAMVSCSSRKGLTLHEYLTTDHKKVREMIDKFGPQSLAGRAESLMDYLLIQRRAELDDEAVGARGGDFDQEAWFQQLLNSRFTGLNSSPKMGYVEQVVQFSAALTNLARTLRYVPGIKNMLLFSNGIARQILYGRQANNIFVQDVWDNAEGLATYLGQNDVNLPESAARDAYSEMLNEMGTANCPVYSFNVSLVAGQSSITEDSGMSLNTQGLGGEEALRQFASNTGGKYYNNTMNYAEAVADLKNVTGAYYILGFSIPDTPDGEYHKIKVKVARKGTSVQSQPGYYNPKPFQERSEFEKMLHLMDVALVASPQSGLPVPLDIFPVPIRSDGLGLVSVYARLSAESMGDVLGKKTEALFFLSDAKGDNAAIKRFLLDELPAGREGFFLNFTLPLEQGPYEARLVLRNLETGRSVRGVTAFQIPDAEPSGFWMDPLLLLEEGRNLSGLSPTPELTLNAFYGYDPNKYFPRTGEVPLGTTKIMAIVRCGGIDEVTDVLFTGGVQNSETQAQTDVPIAVTERTSIGWTSIFRLEVTLGDLPAGRYTLHLAAAPDESEENVRTTATFIIK